MKTLQLRPYQQQAVDEIRQGFRSGKRKALLHLATGGGKTHTFSYMLIEAVQKGKRALMVVRGRKLVDQASKRLFHEGVTHGVLMSGHWNFHPTAPIQVCSIDTLMARGWRPKADIIIIDEAHQAVSDGYKEFLADPVYTNAYVVAVTATPYSSKSLTHLADFVVHPISVQELIDTGFLVPPRYFAPTVPNVSGVKVSRTTGDYVTDQLAKVMDKSTITGDIITHWKKIAENRPTICFAVSVEHSEHIAQQFNEAGIPAAHCEAKTPDTEREALIKKLERGEIKVLSNVGILCTGVDIPPLGCIIMARPTQSYNLYIQQAGRGTRIHPESGKKNFILLDHAGNIARHGFITEEPEVDISEPFERFGPRARVLTCEKCFAVVEEWPCSAVEDYVLDENGHEIEKLCGWQPEVESREASPRTVLQVEGELQEIVGPSPLQRFECERFCEEQLMALLQGVGSRNPWRVYYKAEEKYGKDAAKSVFFRLCKRLGIDVRKKGQFGGALPAGGGHASEDRSAAVSQGVEAERGDVLPGALGREWPYK